MGVNAVSEDLIFKLVSSNLSTELNLTLIQYSQINEERKNAFLRENKEVSSSDDCSIL